MTASVMTIDFRTAPDLRQHPSGNPQDSLPARSKPRTADGKLLTPKQIRARYRRKAARNDMVTNQELDYLYEKPVEDWDLEELARGRPRNSRGGFSGPNPKWITAAVHERSMERYVTAVKTDMKATTVDALTAIRWIIQNDDVDDKGKPVVPPSTKLEASKFLIEHVVGKPTQRIESDVSIKLQAILGQVMVNPQDVLGGTPDQGYEIAHYPGITMALATGEEERDEDNGFS